MSLLRELKIQTIVLLAHRTEKQFNPAVFNQYWLHEKGIIPAEEVKEGSNFSSTGTVIVSEKINMVVIPEQLQVASTGIGSFEDIATKNFIALIDNIGDVELRGMGINFNWFVRDDKMKIEELTKKLFYNKSSAITEKFEQDDAKYGIYLSKNINKDLRLKLDIRPVTITDIKTGDRQENIQFVFNFHSDLNSDNPKELIKTIVTGYSDLLKITNEIIDTIN